MIAVKSKGSFKNTERFLKNASNADIERILRKYAEIGVKALSDATPKRTGLTASSWSYEIKKEENVWKIYFINTNIQNGINIAVIIDHGHGTSNGGYVQGANFITPAIKPVFDDIANMAWGEIKNA